MNNLSFYTITCGIHYVRSLQKLIMDSANAVDPYELITVQKVNNNTFLISVEVRVQEDANLITKMIKKMQETEVNFKWEVGSTMEIIR